MAIVKHEASGRRITLAARTLAGRAAACALRLDDRRASAEHAVLVWDGARWSVRDLGSTNGTHVDDRRLGLNERAYLDAGAAIVFGGAAERWTLEEAGAPTASARSEVTGEVREAEHGLLVLPDASDPRVTLSEDRQGRWMLEVEGAARPAEDHERIDARGPWTLRVPPAHGEPVPTTAALGGSPRIVGATVLRFEVSRDGEHVALSLVHGGEVGALPDRAHHEVLLALARARLSDRRAGLPPAEQGWMYVDDLLRMLKLELKHFNINIFRARQQLASSGVLDVGALVERRSTTRQIRLGTDAVEILER